MLDEAKAGFQDAATAGVVVTGGTSIMEGIPELAEAVFDLPVRRGLPETVGGLADIVKSPIYATAVGLALYGARRPAVAGTPAASAEDHLFGRIAHRLAGWFSEVF